MTKPRRCFVPSKDILMNGNDLAFETAAKLGLDFGKCNSCRFYDKKFDDCLKSRDRDSSKVVRAVERKFD
jgi:hypothetical protein